MSLFRLLYLYLRPSHSYAHTGLFNVKDDPNEYHDLSAQLPDILQQLMNRLEEVSKTGVPGTQAAMGPDVVRNDSAANCAMVEKTGYFLPFAEHIPWPLIPDPPALTNW